MILVLRAPGCRPGSARPLSCDRHTDSGDYLAVVEIAPREMLAFYDVHAFVEHWNDAPHSAIRMVRVRLAD